MPDILATLQTALAGRYRVEREIGAGGMATVYLAHEERYDRRVAIKVLRREFAAAVGADRFLREIKVTAALQHPHILPLFDSGEAGGLIYYVMPYVEGESLRARLDRLKQLPLRDALDIARSVASALDYAHQRGLIHRDIKPENILLTGDTRDGVNGLQALVADFGVSLAIESAGPGRLTDSGLSVGTPAYMSPEQASAERHLGAESDVYALGVLLYEMLTGEPPFTGPTAQAVVAKVMVEAPAPLRSRRATVPPWIESAVMRSLEKVPADRFSSAAQFAEALQTEEHAVAPSARGVAPPRRSRGAVYVPWAFVAILAVSVVGLLFRSSRVSSASAAAGAGATHLAISMPEGIVAPQLSAGIAVGDHGRVVAFVAAGAEGRPQLYVRRLDEPNASALAGTLGAELPVFSPDGNWLAFFSGGQLKKVLLATGAVTLIADSAGGAATTWTTDGFLVYGRSSPKIGNGIVRISENGGSPEIIAPIDTASGERAVVAAELLPGGQLLMYTVRGVDAKGAFSRVMIRPLAGAPARVLLDQASVAKSAGDGRIMYQRAGELYVADLDRSTLTLANSGRVLTGVAGMDLSGIGAPWAISDDVLVYGSMAGASRSLTWVDRTGLVKPLSSPPRAYSSLVLSPDGRRALTVVLDGSRSDAWIYDMAQDVLTPASTDGVTLGAIWKPDGQHITTISKTSGANAVVSRRADGTGAPELLMQSPKFLWPTAWTRDARRLVVMDAGNISMIDFQVDRALRPLVSTPAVELGGRLSPDERWLAYFSNVTGSFELYVTPFPDGGPSWRLSRGGAREAVWSRDGRELFFRSENGRQMLSVAIAAGTAFNYGAPRLLFEGDFFSVGGPGNVSYDVSPVDRRFLMQQRVGSASTDLKLVLGWRRVNQLRGRQ